MFVLGVVVGVLAVFVAAGAGLWVQAARSGWRNRRDGARLEALLKESAARPTAEQLIEMAPHGLPAPSMGAPLFPCGMCGAPAGVPCVHGKQWRPIPGEVPPGHFRMMGN